MEKEQKTAAAVTGEGEYLFDKSFDCPVCSEKFKAKTVKSGRARLIRSDMDLRPVHENIEPLKYEVIVCPHCGYAAQSRYFPNITSSQAKAVREAVSPSFQPAEEGKDSYTYGEAFERYKLCLASANAKKAKASEKAYIYLKSGWLLRSMAESLDETKPDTEQRKAKLKEQENTLLKNALDGFIAAKQEENYPICGMDENTLDYMIAVLALEFGQYDMSSQLISRILTSISATDRMKDRARDVKDVLVAKMKEKNGN